MIYGRLPDRIDHHVVICGRCARICDGAYVSKPLVDRRREVIQRLAQAQKSNRGAGGYSRWINRPLGRQIAVIAYLIGLTPNQVSAISAAWSYLAIAAVALLQPTVAVGVLIATGLIIGYAFDSADGQVARLRGGGSAVGEWLDHVIDAAKIVGLHSAIAICWFRYYDVSRSTLLVPLGYGLVASVFFFAIVLADMLRRIASAKKGGSGVTTASVNTDDAAPWLRSVMVLPNDYGTLCVALLFLGVHKAFVVIYLSLFVANALLLVVACVRWYREMATL